MISNLFYLFFLDEKFTHKVRDHGTHYSLKWVVIACLNIDISQIIMPFLDLLVFFRGKILILTKIDASDFFYRWIYKRLDHAFWVIVLYYFHAFDFNDIWDKAVSCYFSLVKSLFLDYLFTKTRCDIVFDLINKVNNENIWCDFVHRLFYFLSNNSVEKSLRLNLAHFMLVYFI